MKKIAGLILCLVLFMGSGTTAVLLFLSNNGSNIKEYEKDSYTGSIYQGQMFAQDLCVASDDVQLSGFEDDTTLHGAALFDLENESVVYGYNLYDRLYPASTTKVLTAYVALKYGNLEDQVTVSANATDFNWDESICGLQTGDTLSMYDLLCGLMLVS